MRMGYTVGRLDQECRQSKAGPDADGNDRNGMIRPV